VIVAVVVVAIAIAIAIAAAAAAAARVFKRRKFALLLLDKTNTFTMAYARPASSPSFLSVAAADVS
jgi:hypothetical protein